MHLIVLIDAFTKYVLIKAVKSTKTRYVTNFLEMVFKNYGLPTRIIADRGTAFTSTNFQTFCKNYNIQLILNAVATPRANGQVERLNRTILSALMTTTSKEDTWDKSIDQVQSSINNTVHQITGKSPNELLMGYTPRTPNDALISAELNLPQINREIDTLRREASEKIKENQLKQKIRFDKHRKPAKKYQVGDLVLILMNRNAEGQSRKLSPKYAGPMVIKEILPKDRYRVQDMPHSTRSSTKKYDNVIAVDRMKPWIPPGGVSDDTQSDSGEDGVPLPSDSE